jgi:hypothetical protein
MKRYMIAALVAFTVAALGAADDKPVTGPTGSTGEVHARSQPWSELNDQLLDAVSWSDVGQVVDLISQGVDVNAEKPGMKGTALDFLWHKICAEFPMEDYKDAAILSDYKAIFKLIVNAGGCHSGCIVYGLTPRIDVINKQLADFGIQRCYLPAKSEEECNVPVIEGIKPVYVRIFEFVKDLAHTFDDNHLTREIL